MQPTNVLVVGALLAEQNGDSPPGSDNDEKEDESADEGT